MLWKSVSKALLDYSITQNFELLKLIDKERKQIWFLIQVKKLISEVFFRKKPCFNFSYHFELLITFSHKFIISAKKDVISSGLIFIYQVDDMESLKNEIAK